MWKWLWNWVMGRTWKTFEVHVRKSPYCYHGLNVCIIKIPLWKLLPNVVVSAFGKWLDSEGRALLNRISGLTRGWWDQSSTPPPCVHMARYHLWGNRPSPETKSASALTWDFTDSRIVRNKLLISYPIHGVLFFYSSLNRLKQLLWRNCW